MTIPIAVAGVGTQVVPGRLTVVPGSTAVHVTTTAVVPLDGLGVAVHVGAAGAIESTVVVAGPLVNPVVGLLWVAVMTAPLAGVTAGIHDQVPSA